METASPRRRRTPEEARREILDAARTILERGSTSDLTVAAVMAGTTMTRKTFYVHFADLGVLVVELVRPLRSDLDDLITLWSESGDPVEAGGRALDAAAALYVEHSALLSAVWRLAREDAAVDVARQELIEPLVSAGEGLLTRRGVAPREARAIATALAAMNVHSLLDLGPGAEPDAIASTTGAIRSIWQRVVLAP